MPADGRLIDDEEAVIRTLPERVAPVVRKQMASEALGTSVSEVGR